MSIDFITWFIVFVCQSGLLGKSMYTVSCSTSAFRMLHAPYEALCTAPSSQMISLTDLEADNINPFDCAEQVNRLVLFEYVVQLLMTALLIVRGKWFTAALHTCLSGVLILMYYKKQVYMHAADAFKQLGAFKRRHLLILAVYGASFILITYRSAGCCAVTRAARCFGAEGQHWPARNFLLPCQPLSICPPLVLQAH